MTVRFARATVYMGSALLPFALVRFAFITIALTITITIALAGHSLARGDEAEADGGLRVAWEGNILTVSGPKIPGGAIRTLYLEAYCRPECQKADWGEHTVIGHETELVAASEDGKRIELRCRLRDGVIVDHVITAGDDEVDFKLVARNPTDRPSQAHWAQPCMRVGGFTGRGDPKRAESYEYLEKSFVFLEGKLRRMPTRNWALRARYEPGQVWAAPGVPRADVNPRPLSRETPTHGLIGCFSADESKILAVAWEPCQELFQGVITCLHADFRIGGLEPGERKEIRGKLWIVPNDLDALLLRYDEAFPEHRTWPDRAGRVREVRSDETWALRDGKLFVSKGDEPPVHVFLKTGKLLLPYDQSTVVERTLARIDLLSSRHGYNHVSLNIYPDTFDEDADGAIDPRHEPAFANVVRLLDHAWARGLFASLSFETYNVGGGGTPASLFERHPDVVALNALGEPARDIEYRHGERLIPSVVHAAFTSWSHAFLKSFLSRLGEDRLLRLLWVETTVEPQYLGAVNAGDRDLRRAALDFSAAARSEFEKWQGELPADDPGRKIAWPETPEARWAALDDSSFQRFRGEILGRWVSGDIAAIRAVAPLVYVAVDYNGRFDDERRLRTGEPDSFLDAIDDADIIQIAPHAPAWTSRSWDDVARVNERTGKGWAVLEHMTANGGFPEDDGAMRAILENTLRRGTRLGWEFVNVAADREGDSFAPYFADGESPVLDIIDGERWRAWLERIRAPGEAGGAAPIQR